MGQKVNIIIPDVVENYGIGWLTFQQALKWYLSFSKYIVLTASNSFFLHVEFDVVVIVVVVIVVVVVVRGRPCR